MMMRKNGGKISFANLVMMVMMRPLVGLLSFLVPSASPRSKKCWITCPAIGHSGHGVDIALLVEPPARTTRREAKKTESSLGVECLR